MLLMLALAIAVQDVPAVRMLSPTPPPATPGLCNLAGTEIASLAASGRLKRANPQQGVIPPSEAQLREWEKLAAKVQARFGRTRYTQADMTAFGLTSATVELGQACLALPA